MKKYPFKFLDSYNQNDKDIFFGRDEEIEALYEMVFQTSILLIYGASGTGKTSLIQCGLAGKFKSYDWLPLTIRRGIDINVSLEKQLTDAGGNEVDDDDMVAKDPSKKLTGLLRLIKGVYLRNFRPVYLIFDQFEELYVLGNKAEQLQFVEAVKEILKAEQPVKMIFSIREEYLGYLYDFEKEVPQLLRKKLRIEPMTLDKVTDVIKGINNYRLSNVKIKEDEVDEITEEIFERIRGKKNTLTIQLPYLQVFLDKIYLETTHDESRQADALITMDVLKRMGDIGDVLRNFLEEQVQKISAKLSVNNSNATPELVWKILSPFCTLEGTKEPISKKELSDRLPGVNTKLIDGAVEEFVNSRILNYSENEKLYELAHDSLALRIAEKRSDEEIAILEVQRLIKSIVSVKPEAREFFTEKQLLFIEPYLEKFKVSDEEQDWINKSRANAEARKEAAQKQQQQELAKTRKRLRTVYSLLGGALLALIAAGYFYFNANAQKKIAQEKTATAEKAIGDLARSSKERASELVHFAWVDLAHSNGNELKENQDYQLVNQFDGYNCKTSLTTGFRYLYCRIRSVVSFEKAQSIAGINVFMPGGPHDKGINLDDDNQFGHYNPKFLSWLNDYIIPQGMEDPQFSAITLIVYKNYIGPVARALYHTHEILFADSLAYQAFEQRYQVVKQRSQQGLESNLSMTGFTRELTKFAAIKKDYLGLLGQHKKLPDLYFENNFAALSDYLAVVNKDDWYMANTAGGFWVRRSIDGTEAQIFQLLTKLLKTFDSKVVSDGTP